MKMYLHVIKEKKIAFTLPSFNFLTLLATLPIWNCWNVHIYSTWVFIEFFGNNIKFSKTLLFYFSVINAFSINIQQSTWSKSFVICYMIFQVFISNNFLYNINILSIYLFYYCNSFSKILSILGKTIFFIPWLYKFKTLLDLYIISVCNWLDTFIGTLFFIYWLSM